MYRNAQSNVIVNGAFSLDFLVQVGLYQGSVLSPLLFIIVQEAPSREIKSGCPNELFYAVDMALVNETIECLKGRLEAWTGTLESKWLRENVKNTKTMISSKNAGKVTIEGKFPCAVLWKGIGSNSILCQFCKY